MTHETSNFSLIDAANLASETASDSSPHSGMTFFLRNFFKRLLTLPSINAVVDVRASAASLNFCVSSSVNSLVALDAFLNSLYRASGLSSLPSLLHYGYGTKNGRQSANENKT